MYVSIYLFRRSFSTTDEQESVEKRPAKRGPKAVTRTCSRTTKTATTTMQSSKMPLEGPSPSPTSALVQEKWRRERSSLSWLRVCRRAGKWRKSLVSQHLKADFAAGHRKTWPRWLRRTRWTQLADQKEILPYW